MKTEFRYNNIDLNILLKYREKEFGSFEDVFHEMLSATMQVSLHISRPTRDRDCFMVMTEGMGAYPMPTPPEPRPGFFQRLELILYLPRDWKFDFDGDDYYWPLQVMKDLARLPLQAGTSLGLYFAVPSPAGKPWEKTQFTGVMLLPYVNIKTGHLEEKFIKLSNGDLVHILMLIPLYQEEWDYRQKYGGDKLLEKFGHHFPDKQFLITNPKRENIFDRNKPIDLDRYRADRLKWEDSTKHDL